MVRLATPKPWHARFLLIGVLMVAHLTVGGPSVRADGQSEAAAATPAIGPALLRDDFSEPSGPWIVHTGDDHRYDSENGEYVMTLSPWNTAISISTSTELRTTDYQLDVEARLLPASARGSYVVLGVRKQADGASYRAAFDPYASTVQIYEIQGWSSTSSPAQAAQVRSPIYTPRQTSTAFHSGAHMNRYSLRAQGAQLTAFVNGEDVVTVNGASLADGGILFGVGHARDGLADARFDNLLVTGLPGLPGEDGLVESAGGAT